MRNTFFKGIIMETLNFTKQGDFYQAEFVANNDYSLHIEREDTGLFAVMQRTGSQGDYVQCGLPSNLARGWKKMDYAFSHGVYPMNIRLISENPVTIANRNEAQ